MRTFIFSESHVQCAHFRSDLRSNVGFDSKIPCNFFIYKWGSWTLLVCFLLSAMAGKFALPYSFNTLFALFGAVFWVILLLLRPLFCNVPVLSLAGVFSMPLKFYHSNSILGVWKSACLFDHNFSSIYKIVKRLWDWKRHHIKYIFMTIMCFLFAV